MIEFVDAEIYNYSYNGFWTSLISQGKRAQEKGSVVYVYAYL